MRGGESRAAGAHRLCITGHHLEGDGKHLHGREAPKLDALDECFHVFVAPGAQPRHVGQVVRL